MKRIYLLALSIVFFLNAHAQNFVEKAEIEFEANTNLKKRMGNDSWDEKIKETMSDLKTSYYKYTFDNNKSVFKFDRWSDKTKIPKYEKEGDEENIWYYDFTSNVMNIQKQIIGANLVIADTINKIEWKITNENREIAGYNCRKAVGKIYDEVYVFAFYTDEIMISGGPCSINGLPGMILGVTIPRLYTSYVATKVNIATADSSIIKPLVAKKTFTFPELKTFLLEKTKDWFTYGTDEEEKTKQKNLFLWDAYL